MAAKSRTRKRCTGESPIEMLFGGYRKCVGGRGSRLAEGNPEVLIDDVLQLGLAIGRRAFDRQHLQAIRQLDAMALAVDVGLILQRADAELQPHSSLAIEGMQRGLAVREVARSGHEEHAIGSV